MMIKRPATTGRSGALTLEAAVVYPLMLTLVFMLVIGGMGVFRYQQVACQAREAARWAAVHGSDWHKETGQAYPTSANILQQAVLPLAAGMDTSNLSVQVKWLDQVSAQVVDWDAASKYPLSVTAANQGVSNRVRVTVTYQWTPELFLLGPIRLQSTSEMPMCY
jgi:Flp pilus assembly protein TadG